MTNNKLKGFSLAELLIALLVASVLLSAVIPTITKRSIANRENIWRWAQKNNNAYFGVGGNQSAIIGAESIPLEGENLNKIFLDSSISINDLNFSNHGDKLVLVKKTLPLGENSGEQSDFINSHISFYSVDSSSDATTSNIYYTGRIATGKHALAFGIGALQSLSDSNIVGNTALGQYTLLQNKSGAYNTAVGEKALSYNAVGDYNTALGYTALFKSGYSGDSGASNQTASNTAVGYAAAANMSGGSGNSIVGAEAMTKNNQGDNNVIVGYLGMSELTTGSNNVAIGSAACQTIQKGTNNICIGTGAGIHLLEKDASDNDFGLYIGSVDEDISHQIPIITGRSQHIVKNSKDLDKELNINTRKFQIKTFNGNKTIMEVDSMVNGNNGYGFPQAGKESDKGGYSGIFQFSLMESNENNLSFSLTSKVPGNNQTNRVVIGAVDKKSVISVNGENAPLPIDISFNDRVSLVFPNSITTSLNCIENACLNMVPYTSSEQPSLGLNNRISIVDSSGTPKLSLNNNIVSVKPGSSNNAESNYNVNFAAPKASGTTAYDGINFYIASSGTSISVQQGTNQLGLSSNQIWGNTIDNKGNAKASLFGISEQDVTFKNLETLNKVSELSYNNNTEYTKHSLLSTLNEIWYAVGKINDKVKKLEQQNTSDARLKNISGPSSAGLKEINALEIKNYTFKSDKQKTPHVGVIAQQLQKVFPNSVYKGEDGYLRISKDEIFYAMVNAVKELFNKIQDLTAKITGLDKRITELEKQNAQLKKQNAEFEKRLSRLEKISK